MDIALAALQLNDKTVEAQGVVFEAADELWRFILSITTHAIWLKRLQWIENDTNADECHNAISRAGLR